jgi:hypothetical protein
MAPVFSNARVAGLGGRVRGGVLVGLFAGCCGIGMSESPWAVLSAFLSVFLWLHFSGFT